MSPLEGQPGGGEPLPGAASAESQTEVKQEIDLQVLAEKVYELLKRELMLERERLGRSRP